jgi:diadenylate cyclase
MFTLFTIGFIKFTLIDLIDITLVGVLFYFIYRALKDTVAVQILFGMVLIIALSFITEAVNLKSLNWILKTLSGVWLIAFVILFQPELRKMLMLLTRSPVFQIFMKSHIAETVDEVVDACIEMSEKHVGALLVFSRSQNVQMTIDTGIRINAEVSRELLLSIFNTKSPLHDGAVILDNKNVVAARCVLPLSTTTKIGNKNLGTRHRAGLGISEQIDVLVIIVSEETGWISLAYGGELYLNIKPDKLLDELNKKLSEN